jgi:hypothetical protein
LIPFWRASSALVLECYEPHEDIDGSFVGRKKPQI